MRNLRNKSHSVPELRMFSKGLRLICQSVSDRPERVWVHNRVSTRTIANCLGLEDQRKIRPIDFIKRQKLLPSRTGCGGTRYYTPTEVKLLP